MSDQETEDAGAEMSVAATLLRDAASWDVVSPLLTEEMFTVPEARRVFAAAATLDRLLGAGGRGRDSQGALAELERCGALASRWAGGLSPLPAEALREAALRISDLWVHRLIGEVARADDARADALMARVWEQVARLRAAAAARQRPLRAVAGEGAAPATSTRPGGRRDGTGG